MTKVGMHEAKTTLSKLVALAEAGEDVVIERRGQPVARIVKYEQPRLKFSDLYGISEGKIPEIDDSVWFGSDPEIEALFYGDDPLLDEA